MDYEKYKAIPLLIDAAAGSPSSSESKPESPGTERTPEHKDLNRRCGHAAFRHKLQHTILCLKCNEQIDDEHTVQANTFGDRMKKVHNVSKASEANKPTSITAPPKVKTTTRLGKHTRVEPDKQDERAQAKRQKVEQEKQREHEEWKLKIEKWRQEVFTSIYAPAMATLLATNTLSVLHNIQCMALFWPPSNQP
ncbi:hypothetical protein DM01DRAFT_1383017 [Hesseltinella vesiculosa]|uniref:Uncharacterized protein n=1 Tax=Hesseltinella vesiculosa TaxID=101127 RepID=A0A1X2GJD6_9FUNG|nr:hypothetical protein DM01DRAFT_1383017 [Hesseltinella vesiculosa]